MENGLASVIGSGVSAGANIGSQLLSYGLQKRLLRDQYGQYLSNARAVGATPAAIAQGLTGSGPSSMPSVSAGASMPDLASNMIAEKDVNSQVARREKENEETDMRLLFEPKKYRVDFMKSFSEVMKNNQSIKTDKALADWYREQSNTMRQMRPWQIRTLQMGLVKSVAEYDNILQNTKESKSREYKNYAEVGLMEHQANYYDAQAGYANSLSMNEDLKSFRLHFDNMCLSAGYDLQNSAGENLKRWMITSPKKFRAACNAMIQTANIVDGKLQDTLGKNYKSWLKAGAGAYLFGKLRDRHLNHAEQMSRIIGNFLPFANPAPASAGNGYTISF